MKIKIEMVDGFLLSLPEGKTSAFLVARVRWQEKERGQYRTANIIVDEVTPSNVVLAVSYYLKEQGK